MSSFLSITLILKSDGEERFVAGWIGGGVRFNDNRGKVEVVGGGGGPIDGFKARSGR